MKVSGVESTSQTGLLVDYEVEDVYKRQSVFYTVLTGVTAMLLHTMIVIVVSIVSKNSFHAIITSAAIYFVPLCISFVLENEVALKVFSLFPAPHTNTHLVLEFAGTLLPLSLIHI